MLVVRATREVIESLCDFNKHGIDLSRKIMVLVGSSKNISRFYSKYSFVFEPDMNTYRVYDNDLCNVLLVYDGVGWGEYPYLCELEAGTDNDVYSVESSRIKLPKPMITCNEVSFCVNRYDVEQTYKKPFQRLSMPLTRS